MIPSASALWAIISSAVQLRPWLKLVNRTPAASAISRSKLQSSKSKSTIAMVAMSPPSRLRRFLQREDPIVYPMAMTIAGIRSDAQAADREVSYTAE